MAITHTLVPNQMITSDNLAGPLSIALTELSDGDTGTGLQADPANGLAIFAMSDLDNSQVTNGSTIAINLKSQVDTKNTIELSVSYNGGDSYIALAEYVTSGDNESSFVFATYNAASEGGNTDELNLEQVDAMIIAVQISLGIIHDLNVTIDDGTGGRIRVSEGRVLFREGRIRI